jgi:thiamine-monophosphate kinase
MLAEFELIKKISKKFLVQKENLIGIGDDCAVVKMEDKYLLYTIDSMVQDVHFDIKLGLSWIDVGYKAVVRAISDIGAMGGMPEYILVALSLRKDFSNKICEQLITGIQTAVKEYGVMLIGGDITSSKTVNITVSVIGSCSQKPILRKGAKIGDDIYITGYTGLSSMGLFLLKKGIKSKDLREFIESYKRPKARIDLGRELLSLANSMIDISDGLIGDLKHILDESKVGALIEKDLIPIHSDFFKTSIKKSKIYEHILNGGDDYELLFTADKKKEKEIEKLSIKNGVKITKIGSIVKRGFFIKEDNNILPLISKSYEHFR